ELPHALDEPRLGIAVGIASFLPRRAIPRLEVHDLLGGLVDEVMPIPVPGPACYANASAPTPRPALGASDSRRNSSARTSPPAAASPAPSSAMQRAAGSPSASSWAARRRWLQGVSLLPCNLLARRRAQTR